MAKTKRTNAWQQNRDELASMRRKAAAVKTTGTTQKKTATTTTRTTRDDTSVRQSFAQCNPSKTGGTLGAIDRQVNTEYVKSSSNNRQSSTSSTATKQAGTTQKKATTSTTSATQKKTTTSTSGTTQKRTAATTTRTTRDDASVRQSFAQRNPSKTGGTLGAIDRQVNTEYVKRGGTRISNVSGKTADFDVLGPTTKQIREEYSQVIDNYGGNIENVPQDIRNYYISKLLDRRKAIAEHDRALTSRKNLLRRNDDGDDVHVNLLQRLGAIGQAAGSRSASGYAASMAVTGEVLAPRNVSEHAAVQEVEYNQQRLAQERQDYLDELSREGRTPSANDAMLQWYNRQLASFDEALANTRQTAQRSVQNQSNAIRGLRDYSFRMADKGAAATETALEDTGAVGSFLVNTGISGAEMLGDAVVRTATGSGMAPMVTRVFGNTATDVAQHGGSLDQQLYEGARAAAIEYATEKLSGGNPVYDRGEANLLTDAAYYAYAAGGQGAASTGYKALSATSTQLLSEGLEEVISDILNPLANRAAIQLGADYDLDTSMPSAGTLLQDAAGAMLLGGLENAGARVTDRLSGSAPGGTIKLSSRVEDKMATQTSEQVHPLVGRLDNRMARKWYVYQNSQIPTRINTALPLEEQARTAFDMRNQNRTTTRDMMSDRAARQRLDEEEPNHEFDKLLQKKMSEKHMTREQALKDMIRTSAKTRSEVNKNLGLGRKYDKLSF